MLTVLWGGFDALRLRMPLIGWAQETIVIVNIHFIIVIDVQETLNEFLKGALGVLFFL